MATKKTGKWYDDVSEVDAKYVAPKSSGTGAPVTPTNQALADKLASMGITVKPSTAPQTLIQYVSPTPSATWTVSGSNKKPTGSGAMQEDAQASAPGYTPGYAGEPQAIAMRQSAVPATVVRQQVVPPVSQPQVNIPGYVPSQPLQQQGPVPRLRSPIRDGYGDVEPLNMPANYSPAQPNPYSRQSAVPAQFVGQPSQPKVMQYSAPVQGPMTRPVNGPMGDVEMLDAPVQDQFQLAGMKPNDFRPNQQQYELVDYNAPLDYYRQSLANLKNRQAPTDYRNPVNSLINNPAPTYQYLEQAASEQPAWVRQAVSYLKWVPYFNTLAPALGFTNDLYQNSSKARADMLGGVDPVKKAENFVLGTGYGFQYISDVVEAQPLTWLGSERTVGEAAGALWDVTLLGGDKDRPVFAPPGNDPLFGKPYGGNTMSLWGAMQKSWNLWEKNMANYLQARGGTMYELNPEEQIAARRTLLNGYSGAPAMEETYYTLLNRQDIIIQKSAEAQRAIERGDMLRAAELGVEVERLEHGTWIDIVDANTNIGREVILSGILDPLNAIGPITKALGLAPIPRRIAQALRASRITDADAIARVESAIERTAKIIDETGTLLGANKINPFQAFFGLESESRAARASMRLYETYTQILANASTKSDAYRLITTLMNNPAELVRGLDNMSFGTFKLGGAVVGNKDFTDAFNVLAEARKVLPQLESLTGDGPFNLLHALAELDEVTYASSRRVYGMPDWDLPRGTTVVRMVDGTNGKKVLEYVGAGPMEYVMKGGKKVEKVSQIVISRSAEMTAAEAAKQMNSINTAIKAGTTEPGWYRLMRFPDRFQRAVVSELNLNMKPSYWVRNAMSAYGHLWFDNSFSIEATSKLIGDLQEIFGGALPTQRLAEGFNEAHMSRAIASSALAMAEQQQKSKSLFRKIWPKYNPIAAWSEAGAGIAFGNKSINIGDIASLPVGEQNFYMRAFVVPFRQALKQEWVRTIRNANIVEQLTAAGIDATLAKQVESLLVDSVLKGRQGVAKSISSLLNGNVVLDFKAAGVVDEALTESTKKALEQLAIRYAQGEDKAVIEALVDDALFVEESLFHALRNEVPPDIGREVWTRFEELQDTQGTIKAIENAAKRAGVDPVLATRQMQELMKKYANLQSNGLKTLFDNMETSNLSSYRSLITDVWNEVYKLKNAARAREIELANAKDWEKFLKEVPALWDDTLKKIDNILADATVNIDAVRDGTYKPKGFDVWKTMGRLWNVNDDAIATVMRKPSKGASSPIMSARVNAMRSYIDKYTAGAYLAAQRYGGDIDTIDVLLSAERKTIQAGEQASGYIKRMQPLYDMKNAAQRAEFYRESAKVWNDYTKTVGAYWQGITENIVSDWARKTLGQDATFGVQLAGGAGEMTSRQFTLIERVKGGWRVMDQAGQTVPDIMPDSKVPAQAVAAYERAMKIMGDKQYEQIVQEIYEEAGQIIDGPTTALVPVRPSGVPAVAEAVAPTPAAKPLTSAAINEIRAFAKAAGIDTITESGKAFDSWLINVANKDLGINITKMSDLTPEQADELMGALRARALGVEVQTLDQVQKVAPSPAGEVKGPLVMADKGTVDTRGIVFTSLRSKEIHDVAKSVEAKPVMVLIDGEMGAEPKLYELVSKRPVGPGLEYVNVKPVGGKGKLQEPSSYVREIQDANGQVIWQRGNYGDHATAPVEQAPVEDLLAKGDAVSALPAADKAQELTSATEEVLPPMGYTVDREVRSAWKELEEIRTELAGLSSDVMRDEIAGVMNSVEEVVFDPKARIDLKNLTNDIMGAIEDANKSMADLIREQSDKLAATLGTKAPNMGDIASFRAELVRDAKEKILNQIFSGATKGIAATPEQKRAIMGVVNQLLPKYDNALYGATRAGRAAADFTMLDYTTRHGFDTLLSLFSTYHFWQTRSARNWLERVMLKPSLLSMYFRSQRSMELQNRNNPVRAQGTMGAPGFDYRIQHPLSLINPLFDLLDVSNFADPGNAAGAGERALETAKGYGFGPSPAWDAGIKLLLDQYGPRQDGTYRMDDLQLGDYIWLVKLFNNARQGMTGQVGTNFFTAGDQFDTGRVGREIAIEVFNGTAPARIGKWALGVAAQVQRSLGPLPEQPKGQDAQKAYERAAREAGWNAFITSLSSNLLGLRVIKLTGDEIDMRQNAQQSLALGYDPNRFGSQEARDVYGEQVLPGGNTRGDAANVMWAANRLYDPTEDRPDLMAAKDDMNAEIEPVKEEAQKAVDKAIMGDKYITSKEIRAIREKYEAQIDEIKARYPSVEKFEPTPEELTSMYSDYNPDEINAAVRESAVFQARRELAALKPKPEEKPGDAPEYIKGSGKQAYEKWKKEKAAWDAAWDQYEKKYDAYDTAVEKRIEEIINNPRLSSQLVGGWPTGYTVYDVAQPGYPEPTSMGTAQEAIDYTNYKGKSELEVAQLQYDSKMQDISDEYYNLPNSDAKKKFLAENKEFAEWLAAQERKAGRTPWWQDKSSSGGGRSYRGSGSRYYRSSRRYGSSSRRYGSSRGGRSGGGGGSGGGSGSGSGVGESDYFASIAQLAANTPRVNLQNGGGLNPILWSGILQRLRYKG